MKKNSAMQRIHDHAKRGADLRLTFFAQYAKHINTMALRIAHALACGNKILLCGNGGSAADAQHLAAEFVNRFLIDRPPLPAIALTTDTSIITSIGNDFSFDDIFSKQVFALGNEGDYLIAISTSGNSKNVINAVNAAKDKGMYTLGLTGKDGGAMLQLCDFSFVVRDKSTALAQEIHITLGHLLCELIDYYLFENVAELTPYLDGSISLPEPEISPSSL